MRVPFRLGVRPAVRSRRRRSSKILQSAIALLGAVAFVHAPLGATPVEGTPGRAGAVTFTRDVVPILQRACQDCHRPGEIAPMSLLDFGEARPWAKAIKRAVVTRKMPPWGAEPLTGRFENNPSLSEEEIATIARWVDSGAPRGNPAHLPVPREFPPEGWTIGEPDLVLTMAEDYELAADGPDRFEYFELPTGLTEDRWVSGVEIRPGNRKVVHHVMAYAQQDGEEEEWDSFQGRNSDLMIEYAVGNRGDVFAPGSGRLLKAGSTVLMQVHYHPYGEMARDRTRIGFTFHPAGTTHRRVLAKPILTRAIHIPAGAGDVRFETTRRFSRPFRIISFQPHMHGRGKSMTLEAMLPDGRTETLCDVVAFDFNWQITYTFKQPPRLPAGTVLRVSASYDNTSANPNNPDPSTDVGWGRETTDEMMIGWTDFVYADDE